METILTRGTETIEACSPLPKAKDTMLTLGLRNNTYPRQELTPGKLKQKLKQRIKKMT
jgi:hypothetical protein